MELKIWVGDELISMTSVMENFPQLEKNFEDVGSFNGQLEICSDSGDKILIEDDLLVLILQMGIKSFSGLFSAGHFSWNNGEMGGTQQVKMVGEEVEISGDFLKTLSIPIQKYRAELQQIRQQFLTFLQLFGTPNPFFATIDLLNKEESIMLQGITD